jgi:hypothetical protein
MAITLKHIDAQDRRGARVHDPCPNWRSAVAAESSGSVLKASLARGACSRTAFMTVSKMRVIFGTIRRPAPITHSHTPWDQRGRHLSGRGFFGAGQYQVRLEAPLAQLAHGGL